MSYIRFVLSHGSASPRNPGFWTSAAELLCMCGAAMVAAGMERAKYPGSQIRDGRETFFAKAGGLLYALPLIVFGVQRLMYGKFVATLVPAWIPARLFWAYFVGIAFFASASLIFKVKCLYGASLLGLMFFMWVVIVHAPRIVLAMQ
jgi:hypothetical protein